MPVTWNAEADAKLLAGIIKVYDVKVSGPKLQEIAELMGDGCTAKALTHRLSKIRNLAKGGETGEGGATPKSTPNGKTATPKSTKAKGGKKAKRADTPNDDDDEADTMTPSASASKPKRAAAKRSYTESDGEEDEEKVKKVKTEAEDGENEDTF